LIVPVLGYGQDNQVTKNINITQSNANQFNDVGLKDLGQGVFSITQVGGLIFTSLKTFEKRAKKDIDAFCVAENYSSKIINIERFK
jgi:hypothetical protein